MDNQSETRRLLKNLRSRKERRRAKTFINKCIQELHTKECFCNNCVQENLYEELFGDPCEEYSDSWPERSFLDLFFQFDDEYPSWNSQFDKEYEYSQFDEEYSELDELSPITERHICAACHDSKRCEMCVGQNMSECDWCGGEGGCPVCVGKWNKA